MVTVEGNNKFDGGRAPAVTAKSGDDPDRDPVR